MKRIVFISHSSRDKSVADEVCRFLESKGVLCWIAPRDVTPGKNYGAAILDAIEECRLFVLILSQHSNKSGQVVREVERAASTESIIIPFRIEDVQPSRELAFYVSTAHWLDASTKPLEKHLEQLLTAIKDWQQSRGTTTDAPAPSAVAVPPPLPKAAAPPPRPRWSPLWIAAGGGGLLLLFIVGLIAYKVRHHGPEQVAAASAESPRETSTPSPMPTAAASPAPTATEQPESIAPSVTASPTPTPMRRRPGEPLRSPSPSEPPGSASATPTPARLRPGQPLPSAAASAPAVTPAATGAPPGKPAVVGEVAASSEFQSDERAHRPALAFDGNPATWWSPKTGAKTKSITVHFKSPAAIASVSIFGGAGTDEAAFRANNRPRKIRLNFSDGATQVIELKDEMRLQRFEISHAEPTEWITFAVLSVYGEKASKPTPISEIAFNKAP